MFTSEIYLSDRFIVHPERGSVDIAHLGSLALRGATASVLYRRSDGSQHELLLSDHLCDCQVHQSEATLTAASADLTATWHIGLRPLTIMKLSIVNRSKLPLYIERLTPLLVGENGLDLGGEPGHWRFYQSGWQSWSPSFVRPCVAHLSHSRVMAELMSELDSDDYRRKHLPHGSYTGSLISDSFTVIKGGRSSLLAGFITTAQNLSAVRLATAGDKVEQFAATCAADGVVLPPGGHLASESLLLQVSSDPFALLDLYADELAAAMQARSFETIPTGWCTWYYYYGENSEDDVLANVAAIKEKGLPLEYILQDDGYQAAIGDWTSFNSRFPHGIPWLAEQIRAAGFKPGLWLAPFGVAQNSQLYKEHPDWVLTRSDGNPVVAWQHLGVEAPILALDCTHPQVQEWLSSLFRTMAEEWGIEMFKIDFCYAAALPGRRYDQTATRAMALRRGLEIIREAIGERFLLGCGLPLGPAVGIVDGMRISTDVAVTWKPLFADPAAPSTRNALLNTIARFAFHKKLWLNDPDCVICRDRADENNLQPSETRTMVTLMGLSGGMILSGDNITSLRPARLRYLQQLLPPSGLTAMPADLFESDLPRTLMLSCSGAAGSYALAAIINWEDRKASVELPVARLADALGTGAFHVWNLSADRYAGQIEATRTGDEWMIGEQPAHATTLLLIKPLSDHPEILASTFHILGGIVEISQVTWQDNRLAVSLERPGRQQGALIFAVPDTYRPRSVRVNGSARRYVLDSGVLRVGFTMTNRATVEVEFEKIWESGRGIHDL